MNKKEKLEITKVESVEKTKIAELMTILEEAFATAMVDYPKDGDKFPTPSGQDLVDMMAGGKEILAISHDSTLVGGAVLSIDGVNGNNTVELFFISAKEKGQGLGTQAWYAIESMYPDTKKWELGTPYFLKRNIHFYINKCGFKITKYYNKWNPVVIDDKVEDEDFFWFEKDM